MDNKLINDFRRKVNENDMVCHLYYNRNGKNYWNIICSAMDWIEVVVSTIDIKNLSRENNNDASVKMITFISCVDVLWEAIQQLHRVFFSTDKIPFSGDCTIFKNKLFETDDNKYFKTIRSCFAAHPINLSDYFSGGDAKERRYAGWSGGNFGTGGFSVYLYSNCPDVKSIRMTIYFDELIRFAESRYNYLNTIMEQIDKVVSDYYSKCKKTAIPQPENICEWIDVLMDETNKRFENDYYSYSLTKLRTIFSTQITDKNNCEIVEHLRKRLIPVVNEIHDNLQNMRIADIKSLDIIEGIIPSDCQYFFSKVCEWVFGDGYEMLYGLNCYEKHLKGIVNIRNHSSITELYVLIVSGFFWINDGKVADT